MCEPMSRMINFIMQIGVLHLEYESFVSTQHFRCVTFQKGD